MRRAALGAVLLACSFAGVATAYVPPAEKIVLAAAQANRRARTTQALHLKIAVFQGPAKTPLAQGEILTHPSGLARLELRRADGSIERHLLRGSEYLAARDGSMTQDAMRVLPPLYVLQARSASGLRSALSSLGADSGVAVLGRSGDHDCYVVGGRDPAAERSVGARTPPSLWLDMESFLAVRIDTAAGVHFRLGPRTKFEKISLPEWIEVGQDGRMPLRLELLSAQPAGATSASFRTDWLLSSSPPAPAPTQSPGGFTPDSSLSR